MLSLLLQGPVAEAAVMKDLPDGRAEKLCYEGKRHKRLGQSRGRERCGQGDALWLGRLWAEQPGPCSHQIAQPAGW